MTFLVSKIGYFQVQPMVYSIFNYGMSLGKEVTGTFGHIYTPLFATRG